VCVCVQRVCAWWPHPECSAKCPQGLAATRVRRRGAVTWSLAGYWKVHQPRPAAQRRGTRHGGLPARSKKNGVRQGRIEAVSCRAVATMSSYGTQARRSFGGRSSSSSSFSSSFSPPSWLLPPSGCGGGQGETLRARVCAALGALIGEAGARV
jgi:hypothetical protein